MARQFDTHRDEAHGRVNSPQPTKFAIETAMERMNLRIESLLTH